MKENRLKIIIFSFIAFLAIIFTLKSYYNESFTNIKEGNMKLTSIFKNNEKIPSKYTCDGEDIAPEIVIAEVPDQAKSLVLIVDDPDAPVGTFVHWLLYNIPTNTLKITPEKIPNGAIEGGTDFGRIGYGGPCPPSGTHRYFFKLYAIDKMLDLSQGATKKQLENSIKGHIIEKAELIGLYSRK